MCVGRVQPSEPPGRAKTLTVGLHLKPPPEPAHVQPHCTRECLAIGAGGTAARVSFRPNSARANQQSWPNNNHGRLICPDGEDKLGILKQMHTIPLPKIARAGWAWLALQDLPVQFTRC